MWMKVLDIVAMLGQNVAMALYFYSIHRMKAAKPFIAWFTLGATLLFLDYVLADTIRPLLPLSPEHPAADMLNRVEAELAAGPFEKPIV